MAVFLLVPIAQNAPALASAVKSRMGPTDRYELPNSMGWYVVFKGTTIEVSNHLQITGQAEGQHTLVGATLVIPVTSYYGRGPTDMWEWLKIRMESGS
jgi:hypothetical protein